MMNKNYFFLSLVFLFCCFAINTTSAQVLVYEDFEESLAMPTGWSSGSFPPMQVLTDPTDACSGENYVGVGVSGAGQPFVTYSSQVASGLDIEISFEYKIVEVGTQTPAPAGEIDVHLQYSVNGLAGPFTTYKTLTAATLATCTTETNIIPGVDVPAGVDFAWRIVADASANPNADVDFYFDQFTAIEQVSCISGLRVRVEEDSETFDGATIKWLDINNPTVTDWEIVACGSTAANPETDVFCQSPFGTGVISLTGLTKDTDGYYSYDFTGLTDGSPYNVYIRAVCGPNDKSDWTDTVEFQTRAIGSDCSTPIQITSLPYTNTDQTDRFDDGDYSGTPGASCGTVSPILDGYEVVYEYTSPQDDILTIDVSGLTAGVTTGVFVYGDCTDIGGANGLCLNGGSSQNGASIQLNSVFVDANQTIYVVIATIDDTTNDPANSTYTLEIEGFNCLTWGTPAGDAVIAFAGQRALASYEYLDPNTSTYPGVDTDPHDDPTITLQWYPDLAGAPDYSNPVANSSAEFLSDGDIYWVTQNIGTCESPALMVTFEEIICNADLGGISNPIGDEVCESGTLNLSVTKNPSTYDDSSEVYWYDVATGGEVIGVGETFTTPNINQTTSYYASEVLIGLGNIGNQGNPGPVTGSTLSSTAGLVIDAQASLIISTVDVYAAGSGNITIVLEDTSGAQAPQTVTRSLIGGTVAAPVKNTISLNFEIQNSAVYRLMKTNGPALMFTPSANTDFPYPLGPSAEITNGHTTTNNSNYYYFYNLSIQGPDVLCEVTPRTEVVATVHEILPITTSASDMIACVNGQTTLTATSTDSDYQYTWTWSDAANPNHVQTGASITPTILGDTTFTVEGYNPITTCSTTATISITANGVDDIGVIPTTTEICSGETISLTAGSEIYDFNDGPQGWTTQNSSTGANGNPASAAWQIVNSPYAPPASPSVQLSSNDGSPYYISASTMLGPGGQVDSRLISPSFNMVGSSSLEITFEYFFRNYSQSQDTDVILQARVNQGSWTTIGNLGVGTFDTQGSFSSHTVDLSQYAGNSDVQFSIRYDGGWGWYIAIDNVVAKREFADGLVSWSPVTDLYYDPQATIPYDGAPTNEVYFTQSTDGNYQYTALLDFTNCPDVSSVVDITVHFTDVPVIGNAIQVYSTGDTTADLDVTGTDIKYYILDAQGNYDQVTLNYLLKHGQTYYITQTLNNCESDYAEITVELECPAPTNGKVEVQDVNPTNGTVSVLVEWEVPADLSSIQSYILRVFKTNDLNNPVFSTSINDETETSRVINGLDKTTDYVAIIYSICDPNIPVESTTEEIPFLTVVTDNVSFVDLSYYPNPTNGEVYFENTLPIDKIEVYSLTGQKILTQNVTTHKATVSLSQVASGTYFAAVYVQGDKKVVRIIKD